MGEQLMRWSSAIRIATCRTVMIKMDECDSLLKERSGKKLKPKNELEYKKADKSKAVGRD